MQSVVRCNCDKGFLEMMSRTKPNRSVRHGNSIVSTFFFRCSYCGRIFRAEGGLEDDSYLVEKIIPYQRKLTTAQIINYVPRERGYFTGSDEDIILRRIITAQ